MKQFLQKVTFFLIGLFIIAIALDLIWSSSLKKASKYTIGEIGVWREIFEGSIDSEILIYGSSRAWVHYNPEMISKNFNKTCYNLGIDGHCFWLQYLRHKKVLKNNKKPTTIILNVDEWSFAKNKDLYNYQQFIPFLLFDSDMYTYLSSYNGFSIADYFFPLVRFYNAQSAKKYAKKLFLNPLQEPYRYRGYKAMKRDWEDEEFLQALKKVSVFNIPVDEATVSLFHKFVEECQREGIDLIMVQAPVLLEAQKCITNRDDILNIFRTTAQKFSIPLLDYSDNEVSLSKEYFYNASHLNQKGSDLFTSQLIEDLRTNKLL